MNIFRPASSTSTLYNVAKTFLQSTVLWLITLYALPRLIFAVESTYLPFLVYDGHDYLWILLACIGASLNIGSGLWLAIKGRGTPLPLDTAQNFVSSGPYKYVRNPIALGGILLGIAVGVFLGSSLVILYALSGAIFWHVFVRPAEERDLEGRFGKPYVAYRNQVRLWIPFPR